MAIRRGMADYRQAGAGGIIFMGLLQAQGLEMSYEQRRILLRSLYSAIVAKVEVDKKYCDDERIGLLIGSSKLLLDQATEDYHPKFEGNVSWSGVESRYCELLAQILDKLWEISIKAKLIEQITDEGVMMA